MPQTLINPKVHVLQVATQVFSGCSRDSLKALRDFLESDDAESFESDEISAEYVFDDEGDATDLTIICHLSELALDFDWCSETDVQEAHCLLEVLSEWLEKPVPA